MKKTIAIFALCLFGFFGLAQASMIPTAGASEVSPLMAPATEATSADVAPAK